MTTQTLPIMPLQAQLRSPRHTLTLAELANNWHQQTVEVTIEGYGVLCGHCQLLPYVRRAWGSVLMRGASQPAINEQACPWSPPCALNVFFFEQFRNGRHGLPKPYVFFADRKGQDLVINLTVFGLACEWLPAAVDRLIEALRYKVSWKRLAANAFLPKFEIDNVRTATIAGFDITKAPQSVSMQFITAMDAEGNRDLLDEPHAIISKLARRIDGLSRWQDVSLSVDWPEMAQVWEGFEYWREGLSNTGTSRWSARQMRRLENRAIIGEILISGDLSPLWPLLIIGQHCHIGRSAVAGQGRYQLVDMR